MTRLCAKVVFPLIVFLLSPERAFPWGAEGHEAVCEIAYRELTDTVKEKVDAILATEEDDRFKTFRQSCGWPDHMGQLQNMRRPEHYINIPRHWSSIWYSRCHQVSTCLFTAIRDDSDVLKSANAGMREKLIALKFLGHWVGDIHQPLHVSYKDDRGGNEIALESGFGCKKKLHDVWDNCIPEDLMMEMGVEGDRAEFGKQLHQQITPEQRAEWLTTMSLVDWANESLAIARQPETHYCVRKGARCDYTGEQQEYIPNEHAPNDGKKVLNLTSAYEDEFGSLVKERIQKAGVRLGALLNQILRE